MERQRTWAQKMGKTPDPRGYLPTFAANLWRPMSARSRDAFKSGSGSELKRKMRALHSSSALAVNFFEYWVSADRGPLARAFGLNEPVESIDFEAQYPTGLDGNPPNLDVCLTLPSGQKVAIESKFCEWLVRKSINREHFKPKYFPPDLELWSTRGLPECQRLAADVRNRVEHFTYLDVPQLLKHALGLATQLKSRFELCYLYFEYPSPESLKHQEEIARFAARVGTETRFRSFTYQALFRSLEAQETEADYIDYLRARYFADAA